MEVSVLSRPGIIKDFRSTPGSGQATVSGKTFSPGWDRAEHFPERTPNQAGSGNVGKEGNVSAANDGSDHFF